MSEILMEVSHLSKSFSLSKRMSVQAVNDVSFTLNKGEILGLVGESGCGKSTIARCVMNVCRPDAGEILIHGENIANRRECRNRQIIFQDSASALNPRMKVWQIVTEPMRIHRIHPPRGSLRKEAEFQLYYVGLDSSFLDKRPSELSGGQRQRVAIARAVGMEPELLVADEPVAALDCSIQAQIINLFEHLREEHGFSILFIAHDLAMVEYLCDRVAVMYRGRLVEIAPTGELFANPVHPYTRALLRAIPLPDPRAMRNRERMNFDMEFDTAGTLNEIRPGHFALQGGEHA